MNKQGNFGLLLGFFILIAIILSIAFFMIIFSSVINMTMDEIVPEVEGIGMVGSANITEAAGYTLTPINSLVQSLTWITGVVYMVAVIGLFGLSLAYKSTMSKWYIGIFFGLVLLILLLSIFFSNIFQDIYSGSDDFASVIREHVLLSYLILHSPAIFTVVIFISGVIMFSGMGEGQYV